MSDIHELFARDPLSLTDIEFEQIIARFRESRGQFTLGNRSAGKIKPPTAKQQATLDLAKDLKLDLDL